MKVYSESESFPVRSCFSPVGRGRERQQLACEGVCLAQDLTSGHLEEGVAGKVLRVGGANPARGGQESCGRREQSWGASRRAQLSEGSLCSPPGRWEGVLFKHYHLIFIFGCGWARRIPCQEDSSLRSSTFTGLKIASKLSSFLPEILLEAGGPWGPRGLRCLVCGGLRRLAICH